MIKAKLPQPACLMLNLSLSKAHLQCTINLAIITGTIYFKVKRNNFQKQFILDKNMFLTTSLPQNLNFYCFIEDE
jgi:hypothetical protein